MTSNLNKEEDSLEPPLGLNHRYMTSAARRPEPCTNYLSNPREFLIELNQRISKFKQVNCTLVDEIIKK